MKNFKAFTLAEVLITLGIIGVVAAMTLPALIQNYKKQTTAVSVKKFYNIINNALQFSIAQNGDVSGWMGEPKDMSYDENLEFLKKYFLPYIKYNKYDNCFETRVCVYMVEGTMFTFSYDQNGGDIVYFVNGKFERNTRNTFAFQFNKHNGYDEDRNVIERRNVKTLIEPYTMGWNDNYAGLFLTSRGCTKANGGKSTTFCTKLLQLNDWKITDDYPW